MCALAAAESLSQTGTAFEAVGSLPLVCATCSADCVTSLKLNLCNNAPTALVLKPGKCLSGADCPPSQDCSALYNSSCATQQTYCDATSGANVVACLGTCQDRCQLQQASLISLRQGRCSNDSDCTAGLTCQTGKTCKWALCSAGVISEASCKGWCLPVRRLMGSLLARRLPLAHSPCPPVPVCIAFAH